MGWSRAAVGGCLGLALGLAAGAAAAGTLTGPVLDEGRTASLVDLVQLPASAAARPLARVNVLREAPDGSGRLFANDLRGPLYAFDGVSLTLYLDLAVLRPDLKTSPGFASGFVSFAFHPGFAGNGLFYTVHSEHVGATPPSHGPALPTAIVQHAVLTEWQATDPAASSFSGSSRELLRIASPHWFHNLGEIGFDPAAGPGDPDYGWLYLGAGDYGAVEIGEPEQLRRSDSPLGALLRIDPLGGDGSPYSYGIPPSNPFAGDGDPDTLPEIYALGFRNAHRMAWWPGGTDRAFVSDIGQGNVEEIDLLAAGADYGWPAREGSFALDVATDPETVFPLPPDDASFGFAYPVAQYDHEEGAAIAGGFVYAPAGSALSGRFLFGDVVSGRLFYALAADLLAADDGDPASTAPVYELGLLRDGLPTTLLDVVRDALADPSVARVDLRFGQDLSGNLYVTTKQDGFVRRLLPEPIPKLPALGAPLRLLLAGLLLVTALRPRARPRAGSGAAGLRPWARSAEVR